MIVSQETTALTMPLFDADAIRLEHTKNTKKVRCDFTYLLAPTLVAVRDDLRPQTTSSRNTCKSIAPALAIHAPPLMNVT
jgi:hypothetical protein